MQTILVFAIIVLAVAYLGRKAYKTLMHKNKEGSCEHCSPDSINSNKKTVQHK